jgi:hypothetical protein
MFSRSLVLHKRQRDGSSFGDSRANVADNHLLDLALLDNRTEALLLDTGIVASDGKVVYLVPAAGGNGLDEGVGNTVACQPLFIICRVLNQTNPQSPKPPDRIVSPDLTTLTASAALG